MATQAVKAFRCRELRSVLKPSPTPLKAPNPFLPRLNPETKRWAPAKYSLRRQADLVKKARANNLLHLLPPGPKLPKQELQSAIEAYPKSVSKAAALALRGRKHLWQMAKVDWEGEVKEKIVAGADIGNKLYAGKWRMFKGHKWERTREKRVKRTEYLLRGMKKRIERFKTVRGLSLCFVSVRPLINIPLRCPDVQEETSQSVRPSKDDRKSGQTTLLDIFGIMYLCWFIMRFSLSETRGLRVWVCELHNTEVLVPQDKD